MPFTNTGHVALASYAIGDGLVALLNGENAYLGVGDSTAAFDYAQTDLQASTNKLRKGMDAGFPMRVGSSLVFRASFDPSEANFPWHEWGVFIGPTGTAMVYRRLESLGLKDSSEGRSLTVSVPLGAAP